MANAHTPIAAPAAARHPLASVLSGALAGLWLLLALLAVSPRALAVESRVALVIGNANYPTAPLGNAQNDATMVAKVLQRAGFKVDLRLNANQRQMQEAIASFGGQLRSDAVGLFYFAGHGLQIRGKNFLVPVGADPRREDEVAARTVDVQQLLDRMTSARNKANLVILDACRDNPFAARVASSIVPSC